MKVIPLIWSGSVLVTTEAFLSPPLSKGFLKTQPNSFTCFASTASDAQTELSNDPNYFTLSAEDDQALGAVKSSVLQSISDSRKDAQDWGEAFGYANKAETTFYALFSGIRKGCTLGLKGKPFYLKENEILEAIDANSDTEATATPLSGFFTIDDLETALEDDFLDASRGSTDNRKGWKVRAVSEAQGKSFQDARMTFAQVQDALEKGTVIFNTIGAHVPKVAGSTLSCVDASSLPAAVNMYVTTPNKRTSAPPHTDKQDVVVVQTKGSKRWRVFKPTDPMDKPDADMFARGKGDDNLPLYRLLEEKDNLLLMDVTLEEGDVLFIPAAFPHTTDTVVNNQHSDDTSIHLTFGLDTHVWDLDYLSLRRYALRKAGIDDKALGKTKDGENRFIGASNLLPKPLRMDLFSSLPLGFLDEDDIGEKEISDQVATELQRLSHLVDSETAAAAEAVDSNIWKLTTDHARSHGRDVFDVHRDMYLAAIEEGEIRIAEEKMSAHLNSDSASTLTPERMQRLSLFRVKKFYDQINDVNEGFLKWSHETLASEHQTSPDSSKADNELPDKWQFTMPLKVGDSVEADLGGAFFPATVTKVAGNRYDVQFFDGDKSDGLDRDMIKLLTPPKQETGSLFDGIDTSTLTKKELKKLRKKQEKLDRKKNK